MDINAINSYNARVREAQEESSKLDSEIKFSERELEKLCAEISAELGETVTPENIREIYTREVAKVENTLKVGEDILSRIQGANGQVVQGTAPQVGQTVVQTQQTQPVQPAQQVSSVPPMGSSAPVGTPVGGQNQFVQQAQYTGDPSIAPGYGAPTPMGSAGSMMNNMLGRNSQ